MKEENFIQFRVFSTYLTAAAETAHLVLLFIFSQVFAIYVQNNCTVIRKKVSVESGQALLKYFDF
jgi:hypothetical protein